MSELIEVIMPRKSCVHDLVTVTYETVPSIHLRYGSFCPPGTRIKLYWTLNRLWYNCSIYLLESSKCYPRKKRYLTLSFQRILWLRIYGATEKNSSNEPNIMHFKDGRVDWKLVLYERSLSDQLELSVTITSEGTVIQRREAALDKVQCTSSVSSPSPPLLIEDKLWMPYFRSA